MKPSDRSLLWFFPLWEVLCVRLAGRHFVHRNVTSVLQYLRESRALSLSHALMFIRHQYCYECMQKLYNHYGNILIIIPCPYCRKKDLKLN